MAKNLIWLASYPKSGNTWLRAFIGSLLGFGTIHASGVFSTFTSSCASASVRKTIYGLDEMPVADRSMAWRADFQARLSERVGGARHFCKTHSRFGTVEGNALIHADVSLQAVVIVRNPFDVAVSMANYLTTTVENAIKVMANPRLTLNNKNMLQHTISVGSWDINILSWCRQNQIPFTLMRYEDMFFAPHETFGQLARDVLKITDPQAIDRAISEADFKQLQQKERSFGFAETISKVNPFFWKGYPYHALETLDQQHKDEIWARHQDVASALGYRFDGRDLTLKPPDRVTLLSLAQGWARHIDAA